MSLRLKLLLLGLATLIMPWAGCQYAREMESALREGEKQALRAMGQTIAASLQGRKGLLYREATYEGETPPGPFDLQTVLFKGEPFLDGYSEEWPMSSPAMRTVSRGRESLRLLTGIHERTLYALIDVQDNQLVFDAPDTDALDPAGFGDRLWIGFRSAEGDERQVFIAAQSPGLVRARRIEVREYGRQETVVESRIEGAWQPTPKGYRVELRIPLSLVADRFGVLVDDRDKLGATAVSFGTLSVDDLSTQGRLIAASPDLDEYLQKFMQSGLRLVVGTPAGNALAEADGLSMPVEFGIDRGLLARFYRRILERPGDRRYVEATEPIYDDDRKRVIGSLQIVQTTDHWLTLRDRALTKLLNLTLIITALAVLGMVIFAGHLAFRLARLQRASENALTREGLNTSFPETSSSDELGDVARSFSTLLGRLNEYTGYLRTLAGKLAHEIRTPLTIVRSSLENLESEGTSPGARTYLDRAREGIERLNAILVAMGAATRVEEAIQSAERVTFDLVPVLSSAVESYRIGFPERSFQADLIPGPLEIEGSPELVVQLLDKLVDNAVDFSPPGSTITVRLIREASEHVVLEVDNPGPRLAPESREHLFESLWQSRPGSDSRPHFGLGLYIVRLIAEFHGGHAQATDLPDGSGARFSVRLLTRSVV